MATHSTSAAPHQTTVTVDIVSGPSEPGTAADFELQHARRVLARLKSLLGRQGLMDLLARDIEEGNAFLREMAELSQGELRSATTVLAVHGLRALDFLRWLEASFGDEQVLLDAEPDHFVIAPNPDATVSVVENFDQYVSHVRLPAHNVALGWEGEPLAEMLAESEYPFRRIAPMTLPDGTVVGRMLTQFGDTADGFTANLTCYFPASCPEAIFEHHRQHLAVEFTNWIRAAAAAPQA